MNSNMNLPSVLSAVALLGTVATLLLCMLTGIGLGFAKKYKALRLTAVFALIVVTLYAGSMLLFSMASTTVKLNQGQEKYFCEFDCHLAYSIVSAGLQPDPQIPDETKYVVELQTRFDPTTISPRRGNGFLKPNPRDVVLIDEEGRQFRPAEIQGPSLMTPLRPGESYRTRLIFELQSQPSHPLLWVHSVDQAPEWMMIGNEVSPLHRKVYFRL